MAVEPGRQSTETSPEPSQSRLDRIGHRGYSPRRFREVLEATRHIDWGDTHPANRAAAIQVIARSTMPVEHIPQSVHRIFIPDQRLNIGGDSSGSVGGTYTFNKKSIDMAKPIRALDDQRRRTAPGSRISNEYALLHELRHAQSFSANGSPTTVETAAHEEARADLASKLHYVPHRKDVKRYGLEKVQRQHTNLYTRTADAFEGLGGNATDLLAHEVHGPAARMIVETFSNPVAAGETRPEDEYLRRSERFFKAYNTARRVGLPELNAPTSTTRNWRPVTPPTQTEPTETQTS